MQSPQTLKTGETVSPGLRRFLYLTAAVNGAAVLIVEILGAKLLAPYIGTSHFVWTAQISVTLLALAAGYYLGGWMVDRSRDLNRLYYSMIAAAVYLALTLFVTESVSYWCLNQGIKMGSILASAFLFFIPLTLLAITGPFLIRVLAFSVEGVGGQAGRLSSISTLGSVGGAVLIGYVLIPLLPNSTTLLVTAGILATLALAYLAILSQRRGRLPVVVIATLGASAIGLTGVKNDLRMAYNPGIEVFRMNSNFGLLQVIQIKDTSEYFYCNDKLLQNIYFKDAQQSGAMFTYLLHGLAHGYCTNLRSALCIGLGIGIVPAQLAKEGVKVEAVEINDVAPGIAQRFFDLKLDGIQLHIEDGRAFLNRATNRYDAVVLDAFLGDSSPSHLMTLEAFRSMKRVLTPGGVLVMNCFGYLDSGKDYFIASLERTLEKTFRNVRIHDSGRGNVFIVASDRPDFEMAPLATLEHVHPTVLPDVRRTLVTVVSTLPDHGRVLTDDYNPVEYYDASNREDFRRKMALLMKRN
ncbi:MAG: fused MFS/spermidine synthase [Verrucomicrobia bacterium]|nr:fused MFS/spermidine synthase [Verrucomicrobiota bacterium]MBI3870376.1 fused MFS/spermidine synthase [Verrucomicrobiota bacterium]